MGEFPLSDDSQSFWKPEYPGLEFEKLMISHIICHAFPCMHAFPYMLVKMGPQRR